MFGDCCCGPSVRGALGFSKEKSLEYWTKTVNLGVALTAVAAPLPFCSTIRFSPCPQAFHNETAAGLRQLEQKYETLAYERLQERRGAVAHAAGAEATFFRAARLTRRQRANKNAQRAIGQRRGHAKSSAR